MGLLYHKMTNGEMTNDQNSYLEFYWSLDILLLVISSSPSSHLPSAALVMPSKRVQSYVHPDQWQ